MRTTPVGAGSRLAMKSIRKLAMGAAMVLALQAGAYAATHQISINNDFFEPSHITIEPGDTVVWTALAPDHTVTSGNGVPEVEKWDSGFITPGTTFSVTFNNNGRYIYYCKEHGSAVGDGMFGVITVATPGLNTPPAMPTNTAPANGATGVSVQTTLTASAFGDVDGDTHASSQWIVTKGETTVLDTGVDTVNKTSIALADLENMTAYTWKVRYRDNRGEWSEYSTPTSFTTAEEVPPQGTGLMGTYAKYNLKKDAATTVASQLDPLIDFNWGMAKAHPSLPPNGFKIVWEGKLLPEFSEPYRLRLVADGGVKLWVNNQLVIDDWIETSFPVYRSGVVNLQSGVPVTIKIEYFDTTKEASVKLRWSSPSQPLQVIPTTRLFAPEGGMSH